MTNTTPKMKFSALPGAHERHLQRKGNNPLFPNADQYLLAAEIEQARARDQQDLQAFFTAFEESVQQAAKLTGSVDADIVLDLKQDLERLYVSSASLAGDLGLQRDALRKLLSVCMASIENGARDDREALQKIRDEKTAREVFFTLLKTPLVADLIRGDEIVKAEELIPSLLSESRENLLQVLELFDNEQITHLISHARDFIEALPPHVEETSQCRQRLTEMEHYNA